MFFISNLCNIARYTIRSTLIQPKNLEIKIHGRCNSSHPSYTQGQSPKLGVREYFYYIDHQGMVLVQKYILLLN